MCFHPFILLLYVMLVSFNLKGYISFLQVKIHVIIIMRVCIIITYTVAKRASTGMVANPARGQLDREIEIPLVPVCT